MTKLTVLKCDVCGATPAPSSTQVEVYMGRFTDAAGSRDDLTQSFDICGTCAGKALKKLFSDNNDDYNKQVLKELGLENVGSEY